MQWEGWKRRFLELYARRRPIVLCCAEKVSLNLNAFDNKDYSHLVYLTIDCCYFYARIQTERKISTGNTVNFFLSKKLCNLSIHNDRRFI